MVLENNAIPQSNEVVAPQKNKGMRMLLITFIAFMCLTILPMFSIPAIGGIDVHTTDFLKISTMFVSESTMSEGYIVEQVEESLEESIAECETEEERIIFSQFGNSILEVTQQIEPTIIMYVNKVITTSTLLLAVLILIFLGFLVMIIAALKNMKKLFLIGDSIVFIFITAILVAGISILGFEWIGIGLLTTLLALIAGFFLAIKK